MNQQDIDSMIVFYPYGPWKGKSFKEVSSNPELKKGWLEAVAEIKVIYRKDTASFVNCFRDYLSGCQNIRIEDY